MNHDWDQISSGSWHRTFSWIAVAFKLLEDVNDIEHFISHFGHTFQNYWTDTPSPPSAADEPSLMYS